MIDLISNAGNLVLAHDEKELDAATHLVFKTSTRELWLEFPSNHEKRHLGVVVDQIAAMIDETTKASMVRISGLSLAKVSSLMLSVIRE